MYDLKLMYEVGKLRMQEFREAGAKGVIPESGTTERIPPQQYVVHTAIAE
ncbi:MAG: hypothetical protein HXS44_00700 [Theionarchaea archaeon]|nr:hypothetical protein [Theionarchaea archaeon]